MKLRRKTSRIYRVGPDKYLQIHKEWSMKYGTNLYRVTDWQDHCHTLANVPSFAEALAFVRDYGRLNALTSEDR